MTERTLRTRLRRSGWRTTNYPAVRLLLQAGETGDPLLRPCWTSGKGVYDHREMLGRAMRILGLSGVSGNEDGRMEGNWVRLDASSMKKLNGLKKNIMRHG